MYYNAPTDALEVSVYNWLYLPTSLGGSGYCTANPTTATCLTAPLSSTGFTSYIVPSDSVWDLHYILSNDPRPFYGHVSNLTAPDYDGLQLMSAILGTYKTSFATNAPLVNLTLTQASDILTKQQAWATAGMGATPQVTGYLQNGQVTITNPGTSAAPVTVPPGTTVNGATFGSAYGGEQSGWVTGNTTLSVPSTVAFTSSAAATFTAGTAATFTVSTSSNNGPAAITESGALPAGVTLVDNGNGTATLTGTPAAGSGGSFAITLTANSGAAAASQVLTLTVNEAPTITSANSATATIGSALSFTVTTTGFPKPTLAETGALPTGVTFTPNSAGTATIAGTATAVGSFPITITATNGVGTAVTQSFTLTAGQAPAFTSAASTTVAAGSALSFTVTTSGPGPITLTQSGTLPTGVTFTDKGDGTATLTGTPTVGGNYPLTFIAKNAAGSTTQTFALGVTTQGPAFTSTASAAATVGTAFSFTVTTTGAPAASLSQTGALPSGVTFTPNTNGTATMSGTPATGTGGVYPLTLTATNATGSTTQAFILTVNGAPTFTSPAAQSITPGTAFAFTVTTSGYPRPTITRSGGLPSGLTFTAGTNGTATISGTPAVGVAGVFRLNLTATNTLGTATQALVLTVSAAPVITSSATMTATVGTASSKTVQATGSPVPSVTVTGLPAGLSFTLGTAGAASISGTIGGTATGTGGVYTATVTAGNSKGTVTQQLAVTVRQGPAITSGTTATATIGTAFSFTVTTTGYPTPNLSHNGNLPAGCAGRTTGTGRPRSREP